MTPCLYILMRNDLASMVPGKAAAQASHATSVMMRDIKFHNHSMGDDEIAELYDAWENETEDSFGTVIVLAATPDRIRESIRFARQSRLLANIVNDPEYSIKDGDFKHFVDIMTCGYILVERERAMFLSDLELW